MQIAVVGRTGSTPRDDLTRALAGVDHILHVGEIGSPRVLDVLTSIAPVTAVVSHRDFARYGDRLPEVWRGRVGSLDVLLTHLVGTPPRLLAPIRDLLGGTEPDLIAHGQDRVGTVLWIGGTLVISPGPARAAGSADGGTFGLVTTAGSRIVSASIERFPPRDAGSSLPIGRRRRAGPTLDA